MELIKLNQLVAILILALFPCAATAATITIDMVTIGNPGNIADFQIQQGSTVRYGAVANIYQIAKYEVTAGQYTEFLNAVAKADPNGLYDGNMNGAGNNNDGCAIVRTGTSPNYSYSVASDWANRPVNYVNFWDAARFVNWLHNGQPTGAQGLGTTEDGAYHNVGNDSLFGRNTNARFFIPTENEWYKAAYHKNDGVTGNYWDYPTSSDTAPINTLPDTGNHANIFDQNASSHYYTLGAPYWRTEVGTFVNSPSPYGTFDQGGTVWEWNETRPSGSNDRGQRGGSYLNSSNYTRAADRYGGDPLSETAYWGFRVGAPAVPEPSAAVLAVSFFVLLATGRHRRG